MIKICLIKRQESWVLTRQGWLILFFTILIIFQSFLVNIYDFLAPNQPISANILVIEGWITDQEITQVILKFRQGNYHYLITTGGDLSKGFYIAHYNNYANLTAATLVQLGLESDKIIAVPAPNVIKNRTLASALALKKFLEKSAIPVQGINLFSGGPHTRRSWMIFQKVFQPLNIPVGAIATIPDDYHIKSWWQSSEGFRIVIGETIAYLYSLFWQFFGS